MTADVPTLIARLRNRAAAWSDNPESAFDLDVADALKAQSTELAQMNERIDVLAEERARRYHEGACRYQIERDAARTELDALHSWDGLMKLLDEHWPEDLFPTLNDDDSRDTGPRIVSLIRSYERTRAERDAARAVIAEALAVPYDPTMAHEIQMRAILDSGAS